MSVLHDKNLANRNWLLFTALLLLSFIMFYLIGMFLANFTKGAKRSEGVVYIAFFGMLLVGIWLPVQVLPDAVWPIINVLPHLSAINLLTSAWTGSDILFRSNFIVVISYSVVFGLLSIIFFKYE
jgi:ABC-type uncharacterized transport system permease subunit